MQVPISRGNDLPRQRFELGLGADEHLLDNLVQQVLRPLPVPLDSPVLPRTVRIGDAVGGAGLLEAPREVPGKLAASVRDELLGKAEEPEPRGRVRILAMRPRRRSRGPSTL